MSATDCVTGVPVEGIEGGSDECEHAFFPHDAVVSNYTAGNAQITRTHRWLLVCSVCGAHQFIHDHDAPEVRA